MRKNLLMLFTLCVISFKVGYCQVYPLGNSGYLNGWYKIGTLTLDQQGQDAHFHFVAGAGYNAANSQNNEAFLHFRTSNGADHVNNFFGAATFYNIGETKLLNVVRIVQLSEQSWIFYALFSPFTGSGSFLEFQSLNGRWTPDFLRVDNTPAEAYEAVEMFSLTSPAYLNGVRVGSKDPKGQIQIGDVSRVISAFSNTYISRGWYYDAGDKATDPNPSYIGVQNNGILFFADAGISTTAYNPSTRMIIENTGNVGIGTTNPSEKLSVNGNIRSRKMIVTQSGWPDYVFEPNYQLPSLDSVYSFIKENKHLPEIPSAATIEKDGHDLGEVQKLLLKKVEELTLYMIELKKENETIKEENIEMKQRLLKLETKPVLSKK